MVTYISIPPPTQDVINGTPNFNPQPPQPPPKKNTTTQKKQAVMWLRAFARPEWQNSWDYFINLSAADIPIVAMEHIEARNSLLAGIYI